MWWLYHFMLCPFSRKVRLLLSEKGVAFELVHIVPWERQPEYRRLNYAAQTPAMQDAASGLVVADSNAICEFVEQTVSAKPLMMGSAEQRAEVRRLVAWASDGFFAGVTRPLLDKAFGLGQHIGDADLTHALRAAEPHVDELGGLLDRRAWLAGPTLSLADLAIAAQLSVADYFGAIDWSGHQEVQTWYAVMKSRHSFQPLLADRMQGLEPPPHYSAIDP